MGSLNRVPKKINITLSFCNGHPSDTVTKTLEKINLKRGNFCLPYSFRALVHSCLALLPLSQWQDKTWQNEVHGRTKHFILKWLGKKTEMQDGDGMLMSFKGIPPKISELTSCKIGPVSKQLHHLQTSAATGSPVNSPNTIYPLLFS